MGTRALSGDNRNFNPKDFSKQTQASFKQAIDNAVSRGVKADKDGFGDGFEIQAGFNPKDANSKPSALIEIQPAVEISINAELGKTYTLQHSTDMNDWTDSGVTVVGTGRVQNFYRPTIKQQMKYWRVVEVK